MVLTKVPHLVVMMCFSCALLLASIIFTDMMLFWAGVSTLFILVYITSTTKHIKISQKLLILLVFLLIIRSCFLIRDLLYDGSLLLPQDTSYSLQLLRIIVGSGRIEAGMGTGMARSYSYFPLPSIFSSVFILVTNVPDVFFASVLYPILTSLLAIILLFTLYRKIFSLMEKKYASHLAILSTFIFTLSVRFNSLYRQFRLENLAFIFLILFLTSIISELLSPKKFGRQYLALASISTVVMALSHIITDNIASLFIFSTLLFVAFIALKRTLGLSSYTNNMSVMWQNRSIISLVLMLILLFTIQLNVTLQEYSRILGNLRRSIISSMVGKAQVGLSRFNPFDYSFLEIYLIIAGSIALGILLLYSFVHFFREKNDPVSRFFQFQIAIFAALGIYVIFFSPFRISIFERGYFYLLLFSSICASWLVIKAKRKTKVLALAMLLLFFTSQFIIRHQNLLIASKPLILKSNVMVVSERFADFGVFTKGSVVLVPMTQLTTFTAINKLNPAAREEYLAFNTEVVILESDYVLIYNSDENIFNMYISPEIRDILKAKMSLFASQLDLIYNQGNIYVFRGE